MAEIAEKYTSRFKDIKKHIEDSIIYFDENVKNYHFFRNFIYKSSVTSSEQQTLQTLDKPIIEFNVLEAYLSRLKGEFSQQEPSPKVYAMEGKEQGEMISILTGIIRSIFQEFYNDRMATQCYDESLSGGYSVIKVITEYERSESFNQVIRVKKSFDPTLCGFDPLAREKHKGDGMFCFELYPVGENELKETYKIDPNTISVSSSIGNGMPWMYRQNNEKVFIIGDYYEKQQKEYKLLLLANGKTIKSDKYQEMIDNWKEIAQPPAVVREKKCSYYEIHRYKIIGDRVLSHKITDFNYLPLVFVDGNSEYLRDFSNSTLAKQFVRSFIYQAKDAQRLLNLAGQTFAAEMENMMSVKYLVDELSIPASYVDNWQSPQGQPVLIYKSRDDQGMELIPPREVTRQSIPPEVYNSFEGMDKKIQSILGSYDASLGINNNQLSGKAIIEGSTQSNAASQPYITNFMISLTHVSKIVLSLLPKYYSTPRTVPVINSKGEREYIDINKPNSPKFDFDSTVFGVSVEASVSFKTQQSRSLDAMAKLGQTFPGMAEFINSKGIPTVLDNLDIKGIENLKDDYDEWMKEKQQMQQSQGQQNPVMMKMQMDQQKMMMDNELKQKELELKEQELVTERSKLLIQSHMSTAENDVQIQKANAEIQKALAEQNARDHELAIKEIDIHAKHTINLLKEMKDERSENE